MSVEIMAQCLVYFFVVVVNDDFAMRMLQSNSECLLFVGKWIEESAGDILRHGVLSEADVSAQVAES